MNKHSEDYFKFIDYESVEDVDGFIHNVQGSNSDLSRVNHPARDPKNWILYIRSTKYSRWFVTSYKSIKQDRDDFPNFETVLNKWYSFATKDPYLAIEYLKFARSNYAREVQGITLNRTVPEAMDLIASKPDTALDFAKNILNEGGFGKRFLEGEGAILTCPVSTIGYIQGVLNHKIPEDISREVENVVSKHPECALVYAKIKKEPFPLGEKAISEDPDYSFEYARDVIKGRFVLGEYAISEREDLLLKYAVTVIGGKLPEKLHKKMKLNSFSN